jgi:hypothetical protein
MRIAHDRKRGLIEALLDAAARAVALRELQARELTWLRELSADVEGVREVLGAAAAAGAAREAAYGALGAAAAAAATRSSVAPEDLYLTRVQQLLAPGAIDWAAARAGVGDAPPAAGGAVPQLTPQQQRLMGGGAAACSSFTPRAPRGTPSSGILSARDLAARLSGLASALGAARSSLEGGLFSEMPRRLGEIVAAERAVRALAFPASSCGTGGGPAPVLTAPKLSDAMRALEALNHRIGGAINRLLQQQQDWAAVQKQRARDQALERRVMALMFTDPPRLAAAVEELRERVQGLEAAAGGGSGAGGAGAAAPGGAESVSAALGL